MTRMITVDCLSGQAKTRPFGNKTEPKDKTRRRRRGNTYGMDVRTHLGQLWRHAAQVVNLPKPTATIGYRQQHHPHGREAPPPFPQPPSQQEGASIPFQASAGKRGAHPKRPRAADPTVKPPDRSYRTGEEARDGSRERRKETGTASEPAATDKEHEKGGSRG